MLIIYLTNPIWLNITDFLNFFTNIIILHERRKAEINTASQDQEPTWYILQKGLQQSSQNLQLTAIYLKSTSMSYILYSLQWKLQTR